MIDHVTTFVRSNSSMVGAFLVIGALFLAQRYVGAWLTDAAVIDESDIPAVAPVGPTVLSDEESTCDPWLLTFSDDFDGEEIADDRWIVYNSDDRDGNGVRRPETVTIEDGVLVIAAQTEGEQIVSGGMASLHQQRYGRFEARVRTEADPGEAVGGRIATWPAGNEHPEGGENAIYDTLNTAVRDPFYSYIHHPDSTHDEIVHNANAEEWHELAMEWTPETITILRDGDLVGRVTDPESIPDHPHVVTVELKALRSEVGATDTGDEELVAGGNAGDEGEADSVVSDAEAVRMYVDWIRVYQANESPPAGC